MSDYRNRLPIWGLICLRATAKCLIRHKLCNYVDKCFQNDRLNLQAQDKLKRGVLTTLENQ
jgi:hypothetical protein